MMVYPLVYMLLWTTPTVIRIYQTTTGKPAPFGIATVDKVVLLLRHTISIQKLHVDRGFQCCIVVQGFADAVVYGYNEHTWGVWRGVWNRSDLK